MTRPRPQTEFGNEGKGGAGLEPASPYSSSTNQYLSSRPKFNP
jgi:hypothetical protein